MIPSFTSVNETDINALAAAYNSAYSDYIIPIHATPDSIQFVRQTSDLDFDASPIAWYDGEIVGFGFLGVRGERGWVSSVAVLPQFRRRGLGIAIMSAITKRARERGIRQIQLEVNETNEAALKLYAGLGFQHRRRLMIVGCDEPPAEPPAVAIKEDRALYILPHYDESHPIRPGWTREKPTIAGRARLYTAWHTGANVHAYAIGYTWGNMLTLEDVGFKPGHADALRDLIAAVHRRHPQASCRMMNLCEDEPAWPIFESLGYTPISTEIEMVCSDVDTPRHIR